MSKSAPASASSSSLESLMMANEEPLYVRYPVLSQWEFELQPHKQTVQGTVYCTDMVSQTITLLPLELPPLHLLQQSAFASSNNNMTTEIRIVHVNGICKATPLVVSNNNNDSSTADNNDTPNENGTNESASNALWSLPTAPLNKKTLEDRERKAIRQAEESFQHMNEKVCIKIHIIHDLCGHSVYFSTVYLLFLYCFQFFMMIIIPQASPEGQEVFDRLLKACGEVVWLNQGEVISIVNSNIQVQPPYLPDNIVGAAGPALERVRKIVASVERTSSGKDE